MNLTDKDIKEFQRLYKNRYGHEISKEKAYEQGIKLIRLLKRIYQPMTENQYKTIYQRRIDTVPQMLSYFALVEHNDKM